MTRVKLPSKYRLSGTPSTTSSCHPSSTDMQPTHTQSSWKNFLLFTLSVGQNSCCIITHKKKKEKRDTKPIQTELHSILQVSLHLVPLVITRVAFIAGDTWICSKYSNELLYNN